jgi:hypothetical protein
MGRHLITPHTRVVAENRLQGLKPLQGFLRSPNRLQGLKPLQGFVVPSSLFVWLYKNFISLVIYLQTVSVTAHHRDTPPPGLQVPTGAAAYRQ